MGLVGQLTKGHSPSACYLLAATILVMVLVFRVEDLIFPGQCNSCDGLYTHIGKTRPLLLQNSQGVEQGQQNVGALEEDSSKTRSKVDAEETEISEAKKRNVEVSEADLTEKPRTELRKPNEDSDRRKEIAPSSVVKSVWYYTKVYEHPVAKLRELTAADGAPRIQSNIAPPDREITIVTQTSADRLPAVEATCLTWGGALVIAVHVRLQREFAFVYDLVKQLHARVEEQSGCRLDIQLVTEDGFETEEDALRALYPVNALRNVALGMAKTKLIFLLDADFKPSSRLHEILTEDEETYQDLLRQATEERQLFVVPAFEVVQGKDRYKTVTAPETMEDLREGWESKAIECFHCQGSPTGHKPTHFEIFFNSETMKPYPVSYRDGYEPYVIGALDVIPPYDARFRGYGDNKVSHLYTCAADGMGFLVLPNVFLVELPHPPSTARESYLGKHKDPDQRLRILGLYNQFKYEIGKIQEKKDLARYQTFLSTYKERIDRWEI